jgi:hypothetical protein
MISIDESGFACQGELKPGVPGPLDRRAFRPGIGICSFRNGPIENEVDRILKVLDQLGEPAAVPA